jgi:hypothetical protein
MREISEELKAKHRRFFDEVMKAQEQAQARLKRKGQFKPTPVVERCPNGHVYTEASTLIRSDGARRCRTCRNLRQERYRDKQRLKKYNAKYNKNKE